MATEAAPPPTRARDQRRSGLAAAHVVSYARVEPYAWLAAVTAFGLLFAARAMAPAFGAADVIQDDARQHVFWMLRFRDPELFPNDLIADYFTSVAPLGYTLLYRGLSLIVDPVGASKLLPPLLGALTSIATFLFARRLHPAPVCAFLASVLASWYFWQHDDLASASPRAFALPALAVLLWAVAARRRVSAVVTAGLGALLYPTTGALAVALLAAHLIRLDGWRPALSRCRADWLVFAAAFGLVAAILLPSQVIGSSYGPTVTAGQARAMPEFGERGRNAFFIDGGYRYWIESYRSGLGLRVFDALFPTVPVLFEYAVLALSLPLGLALGRRWLSVRALSADTLILVQLLAASFGLFALAHLVLFALYLPTRYVQWSLPLALSVAAGLGIGICLDETARRWAPRARPYAAAGLGLVLGAALAVYPARYDAIFVEDAHPAISEYLRSRPKDLIVAGAPTDADSVPTFAGRTVLVSREYALAYHLGYYAQIRPRIEALIEAYYTDSPRRFGEIVDRYGIDVFLVNRAAYDRDAFRDAWTNDFEPFVSQVGQRLRRGGSSVLLESLRRCTVADDGQVAVVPAGCARGAR